eukprot:5962465-Karenia_brevis.AAC.1
MGYRSGFQVSMLVEPIRMALLAAAEWQLPIAVACTDAEAAFESIGHDLLVQGWEYYGASPLLVAAFYREMAPASAQVVICGETIDKHEAAQLLGGGRPGDVATPSHWNVLMAYVLRSLVPSW